MILIFYIIIISLATFLPASSQIHEDIWYFGENAGLDFRYGAPKAITGSAMITAEGCAVQSSQSGELLFYTNGETIWNRNNEIMENSTGLYGYSSATQSCIIIPQPGNERFYYVFTLNTKRNNPNEGLYYSIVDMEANYSLGAVTTKNVLLRKNIAEKITAVKHKNRTDYWVVGHSWSGDSYLSYKVTESGIEDVVETQTGMEFGTENNKFGQLKASPTGRQIAVAIYDNATIEILDFDPFSGRPANPLTITNPKFKNVYGIEFSPGGTKLYASLLKIYTTIYQFNLLFKTSTAIYNSAIKINTNLYGIAASLQLGPDDKIYAAIADEEAISVISNPDASGLNSNYQHGAIKLNGMTSRLGLPNNYHHPADSSLLAWSNAPVCEGDTLFLSSYFFDDGDFTWKGPGDFTSNRANTFRRNADLSMSGTYTITYRSGSYTRTKEIEVVIGKIPEVRIAPDGDTILCMTDSLLLSAALSDPENSYLWSNGSAEPSIYATEEGRYWVTVTNKYGCTDSAEINVVYAALPEAKIIPERQISFCDYDSAELYSENEFTWYKWSTGETTRAITVSQSGTYWLKGYNEIGCNSADSITVVVNESPKVTITPLGGDARFCQDSAVILQVDSIYRKYEWSTGDSTNTTSSDTTGIVSVWVTDGNGCKGYAEIYIEMIDIGIDLDPVSYDFGKIIVGNKVQTSIKVTNLKEDVNIASAQLRINKEYTFDGPDPFTGDFPQGNEVSYELMYWPKFPGVYNDTLTITIDSPCSMMIKVPLYGVAYATSSIWFPHIETDLKSEINRLPLKAKLNVSLPNSIPARFTATVKYRKDLFLVDSLSKGIIENVTESGDDVLVKIFSDESYIDDNEIILTELLGMAVLGQEFDSPLEIVEFEWLDTLIVVDTIIDGSIRAGGICVLGLSRVQYMPLNYLAIAPNPAGNNVNITVTAVNNGPYSIDIYSLQGGLLYRKKWESKAGIDETVSDKGAVKKSDIFDVIVDLKGFSPGAYRIVFNTPAGKSSYPLMVIH